MDSQTLAVKAQRQQLFSSMRNQRGSICSAKNVNLVVVLLCAVFVLATGKQIPVSEEQNQLVFEACESYTGNFDTTLLDNLCPQSNSFCFPSTLASCLVKEPDVGLKEKISNLTSSKASGIFTFLGGKSISCSLYNKVGFNENNQVSDNSSCASPLFETETAKVVKSGFLDRFSAPPMEIRPEILDWGEKSIYHPSLAFIKLKNLDSDSVMNIYAPPYSSNPQFYPCNFSEMIVLDPGEVASLCFAFFPTQLGAASAQLVLQTSFGGFIIHAKGFAIQSPYLVKPLDISSRGRWRKNLSLFNPFDDTLFVKKVTALISTSAGNNLASCSVQSMEDNAQNSLLNFKIDQEVSMKPLENWEVGSGKRENVLELDVSNDFEGKIIGTFCLQLLRPSKNEIDIVMVPLQADFHPIEHVSLSVKVLFPCDLSGSLVAALAVRNDSPDLISVVKVREVGSSGRTFRIKFFEGLLLFPHTKTQVAILTYDHLEASRIDGSCRLLVQMNDTRNSDTEIPCKDVISICSGRDSDSSVGYAEAVDMIEADEFILSNWKSQASGNQMSVLDTYELLFPLVHIGHYSAHWISVKNPSSEPVIMQLILNSAEVIDQCRTTESIFQSSLVGSSIQSVALEKYGFSISKDALTEALVNPYGVASLGPILFQPSSRCDWRSSLLIRNNLSGVEWLSLQGFGGLFSIMLFEGADKPVQSLEFKPNLPAQLNTTLVGPSCSQPLMKEVHAMNTGDFPLEILKVGVSGVDCVSDGFRVNNCHGFSLQPGESSMVHISYLPDFSFGMIQRDLELVLPSGILVIPMKVSLPIYMFDFCKRTIFWMHVKKATFMLFFAASLSVLLVYVVFPQITAIASEEFKNGRNPFPTVICLLDYLNLLRRATAKIHGWVESAASYSDIVDVDKGKRQSPLNSQSESGLVSDSQNLSVRVGKEAGRRRRKKKRSGTPGSVLFEVSSSHSSNSTPSSPLSPISFTTQKPVRPWPVSPEKQQRMEKTRNYKRSESSSKVNVLSGEGQNGVFMAQEKESAPRKAVLLPSATFPSSKRVVSNWTRDLASTSPIAPYARAPGSKLHYQKSAELEKKTGGVEDKFVYDIWGDHLFGLPLTPNKSKGVMCNSSQSFFVGDPHILVKNSMLRPLGAASAQLVLVGL